MSKASSNKISELKSLRKGTSSKQLSQEEGASSNNLPQNSQNEEEEQNENEEKNVTESKNINENTNENNQNDDKISEIKSINKDMIEKEKEK